MLLERKNQILVSLEIFVGLVRTRISELERSWSRIRIRNSELISIVG